MMRELNVTFNNVIILAILIISMSLTFYWRETKISMKPQENINISINIDININRLILCYFTYFQEFYAYSIPNGEFILRGNLKCNAEATPK